MGNILWSFSTTIRNPERIPSFFKTICEMEGEEWNKDNQIRFQSLLIKNRFYEPTVDGLNEKQIQILNDLQYQMTYDEAKDIFVSKNYNDPPMRGRTSFDPLEKVGLISLINNKITITPIGLKFKNGEIEFGDVFFNALIKQQYPCPLISDNKVGYSVKPFIALIHVINEVNKKWKKLGYDPVGISREEFGIFCLNIKRYTDIPLVVDALISYRQQIRSIVGDKNKRAYSDIYTHNYLKEFKDLDKKLKDYRDNMIRCIRLTKLIYIRGNGFYIDLEPRRRVEINDLLKSDKGEAKEFSKEEWIKYIGSLDSYILPWQTPESLKQIQIQITSDIRKLENELNISNKELFILDSLEEANENISLLREYRKDLERKKLKITYSELDKALEVAGLFDTSSIQHSLINKPSVELERLSTLALNIMDDAIRIKPNYPVGDDNEPTFTAPADVPDIECYYDNFNAICEVTMLNSRDQWVNEGQPVMRHLREFEDRSNKKNNYCLFIAPKIHIDTLNTFWFATKYEYQGKKQKILPLTISQMQSLLNKVNEMNSNGKKFKNTQFEKLLDNCTDVNGIKNSEEWKNHINSKFIEWLNLL